MVDFVQEDFVLDHFHFMIWEKKFQLVELIVSEFVLVGYFVQDYLVLNIFHFMKRDTN